MRRVLLLAACSIAAAPLVACGSGSDDASAEVTVTASGAGPAVTRAAATIPASRLGLPTADAPRDRPRGLLFVIHGGGWAATDSEQLQGSLQWASGYRAQGWATYSLSMHRGQAAIEDAVRAYDRMRKRFGSKVPFCALGASSGGNVALMLAARRPAMRCVIGQAAPTDLTTLDRDSPVNRSGLRQMFPGATARKYSPVAQQAKIRARLYLIYAANDTDVPASQGREFGRVHRRSTQITTLPAGGAKFTHSNVDQDALNATFRRMDGLLDSVARAAGR